MSSDTSSENEMVCMQFIEKTTAILIQTLNLGEPGGISQKFCLQESHNYTANMTLNKKLLEKIQVLQRKKVFVYRK